MSGKEIITFLKEMRINSLEAIIRQLETATILKETKIVYKATLINFMVIKTLEKATITLLGAI